MVGWHHRLNGHEFEQTPGDNEGQGSLGVLKFMGSDKTQRLNNNNKDNKGVGSEILGMGIPKDSCWCGF